MNRRFTWGSALMVLCVLCVCGVQPVLGQPREGTKPPVARGARLPFAQTITDKDVEPFDLVVHWKALTWLGEHDKPTGIYVSDQEVFTTDTRTRLSCFDVNHGKRLWMQVLDQPHQPLFEPTTDGPDAFVVAAGHLIVMDRRFGAERWRLKLKNVPSGKPAVAGDYVYVGGADGWLHVYNRRDQKEVWYFNARAALVGSPVIVGTAQQPLVFVAANNKRVYCLSSKERKIIWQESTMDRVVAPPVSVDRHLYLPCSDFNVYALDATAATSPERLTWVFRSGGQVVRSPVAVGATVYFPSFKNGFFAVRRLDGKQRWWRETGTRLLSVGKRRCYLLDDTHGILICDKLTGKLEGRFAIPKAYEFLTTNVHNDAIYLLSRDGLIVCLRERQAVAAKGTPVPAP